MSSIYYHNDVSNFQKSFEWKFINKLRLVFNTNIPTVESYLSNKMIVLFEKLHNQFQDVSKNIESYTPEEAARLHRHLQKLIPQLIENQERLSNREFFNNENLERQLRKSLDLSYLIEAKAKKIAKTKKSSNNKSEEILKSALSQHSKKNLTTKLI